MDFELTSEQKDIPNAAKDFAESEFPDVAQECNREEKFPKKLWKKASNLGFIGPFIEEKHGGAGLGMLEYGLICEEFARVDPEVGQIRSASFGSRVKTPRTPRCLRILQKMP